MSGSYVSSVYIGVVAKVFRHKKGKTFNYYCSTCDTCGIRSDHCPKCGGKIEKTYQEVIIEIEPYILKNLSKKQIKAIEKCKSGVREALYDGKIFGALDITDQECNDEEGETVLVGKCISSLEEDGIHNCTQSFKQFLKIFEQLKKFGLVKKLDDVQYIHTFTYN